MAVTDLIRGRSNTQLALNVAGSKFHEVNYDVSVSCHNNASQNSMVTLNHAKEEIQPHTQIQSPSREVTQGARMGIQKAEAAALAWSRKTAYGTYAL